MRRTFLNKIADVSTECGSIYLHQGIMTSNAKYSNNSWLRIIKSVYTIQRLTGFSIRNMLENRQSATCWQIGNMLANWKQHVGKSANGDAP